MSFLPSRMSRVLVGGHQKHLENVIETLYAQGAVHLEDYKDPTGVTGIGTPLEAGAKASELLVKLRGLQKALDAEGIAPSGADAQPERTLQDAESALHGLLGDLSATKQEIANLEGEQAILTPLSGLDVDLALLGSLKSVRLQLGQARTDPRPALAKSGITHEVQVLPGSTGLAVLAVCGIKDGAAMDKALAESGFVAAAIPAGRTGTPAERLAVVQDAHAKQTAKLASLEAEAQKMRSLWGPRLAASEKTLMAQVAKTQAPLQFGVTQTTFHIEGWVPKAHVPALEKALSAKFGDNLYVADMGDAPEGHAHHDDEHSHDHDHAAEEEHHDVSAEDEPPIHLQNAKPVKPYQWILGLLGMPRYGEVDPSRLLFIFFPLFFGLMVGDVVVGILIALLGHWLKTNKLIGIGGPAVGKALLAGGIVSILVGGFVFGEALGIHFVVDDHAAAEGEMSWENILGMHISTDPHDFLHKTGSDAHALDSAAATSHTATDTGIVPHASTATAAGPFSVLAGHSSTHLSLGGIINLGYYSKIHDVQPLMIWSLIIGLIHLVLGFVLGARNVMAGHGLALAIQEKVAWLGLMAGVGLAVVTWGSTLGWIGLGLSIASLGLLWMGAAKVFGAGYVAILELPGLISNLVSYTRLAAIGAAKAGLGLALGTICFQTIGGGPLGWAIYLLGFVGLTLLAVLTGSLQSLRLQFVEFFGKFFTGGGRPYVPFGRRAS